VAVVDEGISDVISHEEAVITSSTTSSTSKVFDRIISYHLMILANSILFDCMKTITNFS
jgi:hypothetical protein